MYRFQIRANTKPNEFISLVGSASELGEWDVDKAIRLETNKDSRPIWYVDLNLNSDRISASKIEYQYLHCYGNGQKRWESAHENRWIPKESHRDLIAIDDGNFGEIQPYPYGYFLRATSPSSHADGVKKVLVVGSSVAMGCSSWLLRGWAWRLQQTLRKDLNYEVIDRSLLGANVKTIIDRFSELVASHHPDIVIIGLSLGNEGLAYCPPQHQQSLQENFERGLQELVSLTREIGARPVLAGVYPHGDYSLEHYELLLQTSRKMLTWSVPVIDWLGVLDNGRGGWRQGINFDAAHPNTEGHRLMYEAIDLNLFTLLTAHENVELIFQREGLKVFSVGPETIAVTNQSAHEYNLHPMWEEARQALKKLRSGIYEDTDDGRIPFRTLVIGNDGLESRVKVPPESMMYLNYRCALKDRSRVGIIGLGDRCALRMLLYKMEYDGPAFPFDLTRTINLADVADIISRDFRDMWNPAFLHYNDEEKRIYHGKWCGLSFGHEVEETDDPDGDMSAIWKRMETRYSARAERFRYTLAHADELLFVRTGMVGRETVRDLVGKLQDKCNGKPFRLLILSCQSSEGFQGICHVIHLNIEFDPDRMYADRDHWSYCSEKTKQILNSLGISDRNLFWCPADPPGVAKHYR